VRIVQAAIVFVAALQPPAQPRAPQLPAQQQEVQPPLDARVTRVTSVASGVAFDNPAIHVKGVIAPTSGNRLQVVEIALGATPVYTELATFRLVSVAGDEFIAIAVGGRADTLFPIARLPLEQEVGQILPSDAILALTRHGQVSVTLEAGPQATLAFLYDIPRDAVVKSLKLPDGTLLPLER
jgi:hypothetical protein